jgi:hypothetical protein
MKTIHQILRLRVMIHQSFFRLQYIIFWRRHRESVRRSSAHIVWDVRVHRDIFGAKGACQVCGCGLACAWASMCEPSGAHWVSSPFWRTGDPFGVSGTCLAHVGPVWRECDPFGASVTRLAQWAPVWRTVNLFGTLAICLAHWGLY